MAFQSCWYCGCGMEQEMYGYEMVQAIRSPTGEVITPGEGVVNPVLRWPGARGARVNRKGDERTVSGRSRVYYSLTPAGMRRLEEMSGAWTRVTNAIQGCSKEIDMQRLFEELRDRLLRAGVAPRHVRRYMAELNDHLADLTVEEERKGLSRKDAEASALARLGELEELAGAMIEETGVASVVAARCRGRCLGWVEHGC